jgi:diguanylate cyclase (GGDEF)-like protein
VNTSAPAPDPHLAVKAIREEVVMSTATVAMVAGAVLYLGNIGRNIVLGNPLGYLHTLIFTGALAIYAMRHRIGADRMAWLMVIALYLSGLGGQILYGIFSNSSYLMMGMCFVAASFFGVRGGVIAAAVCVATVAIVGLLTVGGQLPMDFDPVAFYYNPFSWLASILTLAGMASLVLLQAGRMQQRMVDLVQHQHHQAHHDTLTGLPNRAALESRLQQAIAQAERENQSLAVMFLDLDHFKHINDSLGHQVGDRLLVEVAKRLQGTVRASDTVARLGGDEFVIVLPHLSSSADASTIACKILETLGSTYRIDSYEVDSAASIGISLYPQDGEDVGTMMRSADTAMYHAKAKGRGVFQYFAPEMNRAAVERLNIARNLREAIRLDQFVMHYQPQVNLAGAVTGIEALIRWQRPDNGLQLPAEFIAIAEETHLIHEIGDWMIEHVCRQIRAWRDDGVAIPRVAINLSARQLRQTGLAERVAQVLDAHGVPARLLEIEVTESTAMDNPNKAVLVLGELGALGVTITIDDFGTGYSSLSYLKRLPIHSLKIDRSFVLDITHDANDLAIARGTIALAHSLGLRVIAEGVETEEQRDLLRTSGCDEIQGYLIAPPMPADELVAFLRNRRRA